MDKIDITLDAGHGGKDRYNIGRNGYIEADGMLKLTLMLRDKLLSIGVFNVYLTRDTDATVGLTARGKVAVDTKSQLMISNHSNASSSYDIKGVITYYSVDIPSDKAIAERFSTEIAKAMDTVDKGVRVRESQKYKNEDYYTVIDTAQDGGVPHVFLIENGYHTNLEDESTLKDDSRLDKIAEAQLKVICEIFNVSIPKPKEKKIDSKILDIQKKLNKLKFRGANGRVLTEDGILGINTKFAIKEFQYVVGLVIDGIAGKNTMSAMNYILEDRPLLKRDSKETLAVRYIQWRLSIIIDGLFGSQTHNAVRLYQDSRGLVVDGIVGKNTWKSLLD